MKRVLREAAGVVVLGVTLGTGLGLLWGFPSPAPHAPGSACMAPVPQTPAIHWVGQEEAHRLLQHGATFVDARPRDQFQAGHVSGALSVPVDSGSVPSRVVQLLRSAPTVVAYCDTTGGCARSTKLAGLLSADGLPDVRVLEGGIAGWIDHGFPAEAGTCRLCP